MFVKIISAWERVVSDRMPALMRSATELAPEKTSESVAASPASTPRPKRLYADYIRTCAALGVVLIHATGTYLFNFNPDTPLDTRWWTGNVCSSLVRWATPFFILLSGSFMLSPSRPETVKEFLLKRVQRVLQPFAFWSLVYLAYQYRGSFAGIGFPGPGEVLHKIFFQDVYYHLWFIPMIMGLYLLTPTFRIFVKNASRADIEYFLVVAFTFTAFQHLLPGFFVFKYVGWLGFIGFYVLGYYLSTYTLRPLVRKWLYGLGLLAPVFTAIGTWWVSMDTGAHDQKFYIYSSPNVVIMTAALFAWFKEYDWEAFAVRHPKVDALVRQFAALSFGIYFVHVLILDVLKNGYLAGIRISADFFFGYAVHPVLGALLQWVSAVLLSVGVIYLLSKIKGAKKWLM